MVYIGVYNNVASEVELAAIGRIQSFPSDLKDLGAIGTTRSKIVGIDTFFIIISQSRPKI